MGPLQAPEKLLGQELHRVAKEAPAVPGGGGAAEERWGRERGRSGFLDYKAQPSPAASFVVPENKPTQDGEGNTVMSSLA